MSICTIHQIEHLPHISLLKKFAKADIIVLGDTFQFKKNYYENRNKIRTCSNLGWDFITVPVEAHNHKAIKEVKIVQDGKWREKYLKTITLAYKNAPYFNMFYSSLKEIINDDSLITISNLNFALMKWLMKAFDINKTLFLTSWLDLDPALKSTDLLVEICKQVGADTYLSGPSGVDYLELEKFGDIKVIFHDMFQSPYQQQYEPFIPGLSAIDLLFNYDHKYSTIFKDKGQYCMEQILKNYDYKNMRVLEMFGGAGVGHLAVYADQVDNLEIWESDKDHCDDLRRLYPRAKVINTDSLQLMQIYEQRFDMIIADIHWSISLDRVVPDVTRLLTDKGILIVRAIKKPWKENKDVSADKSLSYYADLLSKQFIVDRSYEKVREYYATNDWLYNYVFELRRRNE